MMKLALMRTATGKEDPELPLLQRISLFELSASEITKLTAPQIAAKVNASQSSSNKQTDKQTDRQINRQNNKIE